ncbi:MAG TPA: S4 domain-containing protein [Pseudomonadales bacterium]|nr:S4 domain-containing protein [Pseudomonadales bacterium]
MVKHSPVNKHNENPAHNTLRIDKWLWTARLYKTRSLAQAAVQGGKVRVRGNKVKASFLVREGDVLVISESIYEKTLQVTGLSPRRVSASEALALYFETEESLKQRLKIQEERALLPETGKKPNKKERRLWTALHDKHDG